MSAEKLPEAQMVTHFSTRRGLGFLTLNREGRGGAAINNLGFVALNQTGGMGGSIIRFIRDPNNIYYEIPEFSGGSILSNRVTGLNDAGMAVGWGDYLPYRSFRWTREGGLEQHSNVPLYGQGAQALAVNNQGEIAGTAYSQNSSRAIKWKADGSVQILDGAIGSSDSAVGINSLGAVVGARQSNNVQRSILWNPLGLHTEIGSIAEAPALPLGPYQATESAFDINDFGTVVGSSGNRAYRWVEGQGIVDLNTLLDETGVGYSLYEARGINNSGKIVANSYYNGQWRSVVLTPVPEPLSIVGLGIGLSAIAKRRARRNKSRALQS